MRYIHAWTFGISLAALQWATTPAFAHHEAIFGPQSAAVLSAPQFVSVQIFTRETGSGTDQQRDSTMVLSGGMQPFKKPLSVAVVVPLSFIGGTSTTPSRTAFEDAVVSARYRWESERLTDALGLDESSFMAVGGVELPTGTVDHQFGRGAVGAIAAGVMSIERRPFSLIGYGYYHHTRVYEGTRQSGNFFMGTGAAWTPIDNLQTGRLFSVQFGVSHERTFAEEENYARLPDSGGSGVFVHPGVMWGANEHVQVFALLSVPVTQQWRSREDRQQYRFGAGTVFGH